MDGLVGLVDKICGRRCWCSCWDGCGCLESQDRGCEANKSSVELAQACDTGAIHVHAFELVFLIRAEQGRFRGANLLRATAATDDVAANLRGAAAAADDR